MTDAELIAHSRRALKAALAAGAEEVEVAAEHEVEHKVDLQHGDVHGATRAEETTFGIRVFFQRGLGFATVNHPDHLESAAAEAVRIARSTPPDPHHGLAPLDQRPIAAPAPVDAGIEALSLPDLLDLAASWAQRIARGDARVRIDSGAVQSSCGVRTLVNHVGLERSERTAIAGGYLFGMAVDGSEVGSFDSDGQWVAMRSSLESELAAAADRFVIKTTSALGAGPGRSFRGPVILSPEVVHSFVLGNLLAGLSGRAVRLGATPFKDRVNDAIAASGLTIVDDPHRIGAAIAPRFDREGTKTERRVIVDSGRLMGFLFDTLEGRAANTASTGHAKGSAAGLPSIGAIAPSIDAGSRSFASLCGEPEQALVVSRFSGNCSPVTGEFSGVVKGGFLIEKGQRRPVRETTIAGNLLDLLKGISGVASERRLLDGTRLIPGLRVEDISVTAG